MDSALACVNSHAEISDVQRLQSAVSIFLAVLSKLLDTSK